MPEVLPNEGPVTADDEDFSIFENKSGLAEDLKFLASMPELCDVTFLVGETREPVCAVKVSVKETLAYFVILIIKQQWKLWIKFANFHYSTIKSRSLHYPIRECWIAGWCSFLRKLLSLTSQFSCLPLHLTSYDENWKCKLIESHRVFPHLHRQF